MHTTYTRQVRKIGGSLAIVIPAAAAHRLALKPGDTVAMESTMQSIIITNTKHTITEGNNEKDH
jgi:antitoxin component of MazEF toxin-antitoxin module